MAGAHLARPDVRLLTLTGAAGSGKTRLAVEIAATRSVEFDDGVYFVDLTRVDDPSLIVETIAQVLGVIDTGSEPLLERLQRSLGEKHVLVVLDNCEHILDGVPAVARILEACPALRVLATSREPLRLRWEHELPVPPLPLPDPRRLPAADDLGRVPSVALFVERATAVDPHFVLTNANKQAVADLCVRLDGLPLAIELAAARVRLLSPAAILARLGHGLDLLSAQARHVPARQLSLRAAIDWSYALLPAAERALFRRLGVFAGGWTLEMAAMVCGTAELGLDALEGMTALVAKHLVRHDNPADDEPRFAMLQTLRDYAMEQLSAADETEVVQRRRAEACVALGERAALELDGVDQTSARVWLTSLEREHDNFRAALRWVIDTRSADLGLRLGEAASTFWWHRGYLAEGRAWLQQILELPRPAEPTALRAAVLRGASRMAAAMGDDAQAWHLLQECLASLRELEDAPLVADCLLRLGQVAVDRNEFATARGLLDRALIEFRADGSREQEAAALARLGELSHRQGDLKRARSLLERSLAIQQRAAGRYSSLILLGHVAVDQGDFQLARELLSKALPIYLAFDDPWRVALPLDSFALLAVAQDQKVRGVRLAGAAAAIRTARNVTGYYYYRSARARVERAVDRARQAVGKDAAAAAWAVGAAMSVEHAVAYALSNDDAAPSVASHAAQHEGVGSGGLLTRREREVAELVAQGLTNQQIADALVVSERTVENHMSHILDKLGMQSRTQVATWATVLRLLGPVKN